MHNDQDDASLFDRAEEAAAAIRARVGDVPSIAVVLGSGLGALADRLEDRAIVPYRKIPHFPAPTVAGHHGNLVAGRLGESRVLYLQGRFHYYEGHDIDAVTFPVRVLSRLGVRVLILTAATGGVNVGYPPGAIVCLSDHINMLGFNPLRGPNDERFGPRFPDMTEVYSRRLRAIADEEAARSGLTLRRGVYVCLPGPSYETPAEIAMLRALGGDVVGMSTVPEAIVARHCGIEALAFALVTNAAAGLTAAPIAHEDVLAAGAAAVPRLGALIEEIIPKMSIHI